jgi:TPR repeat protein/V8-like Glu-specific endopeptidase
MLVHRRIKKNRTKLCNRSGHLPAYMLAIITVFTGLLCSTNVMAARGWTSYNLDLNTIYGHRDLLVAKREDDGNFTTPHNPPHTNARPGLLHVKQLDKKGRSRVVDTKTWPNCVHGQMLMDFNGKRHMASGVLVGPHHFLTAGHCVYDRETASLAKNIEVYMGRSQGREPVSRLMGTRAYILDEWFFSGKKESDMALVLLDQSVGFEIGWAGLLSLDDEECLDQVVHVTGYPSEKEFGELWTTYGSLESIEPNRLLYRHYVSYGQSGGAVWVQKWGSPYVIGVHSCSSHSLGFGVRLSKARFYALVQCINNTSEIKERIVVEELSKELKIRKMGYLLALGTMYKNGNGVPIDKKKSYEFYTLAAKEGSAEAHYALGWIYEIGDGVPDDITKAISYYTLAAKGGSAEAQYALGWMYEIGDGVPVNKKEAFRFYALAARNGLARSLNALGWMYEIGDGIPEDAKKASRFYALAINHGDQDAFYNLERLREKYGEPAHISDHKFDKNRLIKQGNGEALYTFAMIYKNGDGVPVDKKTAFKLLTLAADHGNIPALCCLGWMFEEGDGVPVNKEKALEYRLTVASSRCGAPY